MAEGKILPYLDIPFQHASPRVLKAMRRPASSEKVLHRIRQWRQDCPGLTLRSTLKFADNMVTAYPGMLGSGEKSASSIVAGALAALAWPDSPPPHPCSRAAARAMIAIASLFRIILPRMGKRFSRCPTSPIAPERA